MWTSSVYCKTLGIENSGTLSIGDCDDNDVNRHPETPEICDGIINACGDLAEDEVDNDNDGSRLLICQSLPINYDGDPGLHS